MHKQIAIIRGWHSKLFLDAPNQIRVTNALARLRRASDACALVLASGLALVVALAVALAVVALATAVALAVALVPALALVLVAAVLCAKITMRSK